MKKQQDIELLLKDEVFFQTGNFTKETKFKGLNKKINTFMTLPKSNNYVFPKGYPFKKMFSDAKKIILQDNAATTIFNEIHATQSILVPNDKSYLNRVNDIVNQYSKIREANNNFLDIKKMIFQSGRIRINSYNLDQTSLVFYDTWTNPQLNGGLFIKCVNQAYKITFDFHKINKEIYPINEIEEFYQATIEVYKLILGQTDKKFKDIVFKSTDKINNTC